MTVRSHQAKTTTTRRRAAAVADLDLSDCSTATALAEAPVADQSTVSSSEARPVGRTTRGGSPILTERHHAMVYWFPVKVMGASEDECADFYVYAVDQIKRRQIFSAEKYTEREGAKFETWLGVVLRNLYIDLKRATRQPKVDLSDNLEASIAGNSDVLDPEHAQAADEALGLLKPEARVLFKLLLLNDLYLTDEDLAIVAERAGRTVEQTVQILRDLEMQVGERGQREQERQEELTRVFWWVEYYRNRLRHLRQVHGNDPARHSARATALITEVRRKLAKRRAQHAELVRTYRAAGLTVKASYEMIAKVLNTTRDAVKMEAYRCRRAYIEAIERRLGRSLTEDLVSDLNTALAG